MPDWNAIRNEYIAGGISQRELAEKYDISIATIARRAQSEKWTTDRKENERKHIENIIQKTADAAADNAVIAERIKAKLLKRLEKEIDGLPEKIGSDAKQAQVEHTYDGRRLTKTTERTLAYKLRDLTAAYKDLTEDYRKGADCDVEDLTALVDLLK